MPDLVTEAPVLVTGATGYIASHIVEKLLSKGYKVRGTVRNLKNESSYGYLKKLPKATENLELVQANLLQADGWDAAVNGCAFVMHTASPYVLSVKDPKKDLVDPAVQGVKHVLETCLKAGCVKKFILTSSVAAISDEFENGKVYSEADWNEQSSLQRNPYFYSKVQAEKYAIDFIKNNNCSFAYCSINPFAVIGPSLRPEVNQSVESIQRIMNGTDPGLLDIALGYVDVRDVADAHILAMEKPDASGRYVLCEGTHSWKDLAHMLHETFPEYPIPLKVLPKWLVQVSLNFYPKGQKDFVTCAWGRVPTLDNTKSKTDLGVTYTPFEKTLVECVHDLIAQGFIKKPRKKVLGIF